MPVTVSLSRKFRDRFGDDLADELVELFNKVDATYRSELREINDFNFARFDARLEQRLAEFRSELEGRITRLEAKLDIGLADVRRDLTTRILAWNFAFWITTLMAILGSRLL